MTTDTHITAPTRFVEANGIRYAYRRFGSETDPRVLQVAGNPVPSLDDFLFLFFAPTATSQAAGKAFWERRHQRQDQDPPSSPQTAKAQVAAIMEWCEPRGERYAYLKTIKQPTLVVNGNNDVMVPTINSFNLSQHIPNAQLIVYPDAGHGSQFSTAARRR